MTSAGSYEAVRNPLPIKPPFVYFGGKGSTAEAIAATFPAHDHYVEPFAGSLAVLLAKAPARMETVNDLDGQLMTFWRVLRDQPDDLARLCTLTPHSRGEYEHVQNTLAEPGTDLETGNGSSGEQDRTEVLWSNRPLRNPSLSLFEDVV